MQGKTAKKSPRKKSVKKPARNSKPKKGKSTPAKKSPSSSKSKTKLKKSAARSALRSALAKRATRKAASKAKANPKTKAASSRAKPKKHSKSKPAKKAAKKARAPAKPPARKSSKKPAGKASPKKKPSSRKSPARKTSSKTRKTNSKKMPNAKKPSARPRAAGRGEGEAPAPAAKPTKTVPPLNHAEISRILSERYTRHLVIDSGGEYALEIIRGFANNSSDEDMAKKLKIKISDVRATLNKLHSLGIVEYTRHKDSETGWFSYYWFLNVAKMKEWVSKRVDEEHRKIDFSNGEHYYCPGCGGASIHDFVSASDFGFKCPTCGSALDFLSDEKVSEFFPMRSFRKPFL